MNPKIKEALGWTSVVAILAVTYALYCISEGFWQ